MSERVDIAPKVGYLQILSSINYREWYAIAEFIDNSVQSYLEKRKSIRRFEKDYQLVIDIEIDSIDKVIIVRDNAGGIDQNNYQRAFRAAARPDNRDGLSEFGMGMKTAACWFSPKWEVITTAFGEDIEKTVQFDINKIVNTRFDRTHGLQNTGVQWLGGEALEAEIKKPTNEAQKTFVAKSWAPYPSKFDYPGNETEYKYDKIVDDINIKIKVTNVDLFKTDFKSFTNM